MLAALALNVGCERPADVRSLLSDDPQPAQVLHHGLREVRTRALQIQVLVAEDEHPLVLLRAPVGGPEGAGVPQVEQPGGRWRNPPPIRPRSSAFRHGRYFTPLG